MRDFHYSPDAVNKMALGIDEVVDATINFSRKNYSDYFPSNPYPEDVKMVGNTIKSKKMPEYIAKFLSKGIRLLLRGKGQEFLNEYYNYIEKIYNYQIPLKDIASKGKIKKTIAEYKKDCNTLTKAGRPKSRQAWYELCIKAGRNPDMGETIYYINTGSKKSESDIKKVTKWYEYTKDGEKIDRTKDVEKGAKQWKKNPDNAYRHNMSQASGAKLIYPEVEWMKENGFNYQKEYELVFACELLEQNIIDSEEDKFCEEGKEYNVAKYIDQFNKRITPLLVCFSKDIRGEILIDNPKNRPYFTEEQCKLSSGEPNKVTDQDTYEQLMTMDDKEIKFWDKYGMEPPFLKECGMPDWATIRGEYLERMEKERQQGITDERETYENILNELSKEEYDAFIDEGTLPESLLKIVEIDPVTSNLVSRKFPDVVIGKINDIIDSYENRVYVKVNSSD